MSPDHSPIPTEAIAAATEAMRSYYGDGPYPAVPVGGAATAALEAAAPILAAVALRDMADRIDRGPTFPLPPSVISALVRERADDLTAPTP